MAYKRDLEANKFTAPDEMLEQMNLMPNFEGVRLKDFALPGKRREPLEMIPLEERQKILERACTRASRSYARSMKKRASHLGIMAGDDGTVPPRDPVIDLSLTLSEVDLRRGCASLQAHLSKVEKNNEILRQHLDLMAKARHELELRERALKAHHGRIAAEDATLE
jgi:hypothetical protein